MKASKEFTLADGYNLWDNSYFYNYLVSRFGVLPDIRLVCSPKTVQTSYFNVDKAFDELVDKIHWPKAIKGYEVVKYNFRANDNADVCDSEYYRPDEDELTIGDYDLALDKEWVTKHCEEVVDRKGNIYNYRATKDYFLLFNAGEHFVAVYCDASCKVPVLYYNDESLIGWIVDIFLKNVITVHTKEKSLIYLISRGKYGYKTVSKELNDVMGDHVLDNTNDDFKPVWDAICKFMGNDESGIIFLSGIPGSGKTSIIKHLAYMNQDKKFVYVPSHLSNALADPEFIDFLSDLENSVLVLEDCEQLLVDREAGGQNDGLMTLLSASDGILGDAFRFKIICTFNMMNDKKIDPALLRKGRCVARYKFHELSVDKIKKLMDKKLVPTFEVTNPMSLADIYNRDNEDFSNKKKRIGFGL